ncbi:uncharacterized protein FIBRA_05578 [Fibroporia radiculosa]|uniref:Glucose-methanol-choline oxidoreductase N-terminal domain-containing protein n=1 Tax=Fibroporia radiculosa TaxID=599839 RepID=J4GR99_9APHY|nr:uncharacterized protein FIBRA_05578 [Fibroporia radiculosa]CCM03445.1 predicted protein [Fibroporia radiculosa]
MSNVILEASVNLGVSCTNDFNTEEGALGVGPFIGAIDGRNQRAWLYEILKRTQVYRKLCDHCISRSRGAQTTQSDIITEQILFTTNSGGVAHKEVIVCAGAVGSPHLLMVSGIGPVAYLAEIGVPVVYDSPTVGSNLLDHLSVGAMISRAKPGMTLDFLYRPAFAAWALLQWLMFGSGPMSSLLSQIGLFIRSDDERLPFSVPSRGTVPPSADHTSGPNAPDVEVVTCPMAVIESEVVIPPANGVTIEPILLQPESRGTVRLQSTRIWDKPLINPNYLATEGGRNILKSMRLIIRLARTEPLASSLVLQDANNDFDPYWPSDVNPTQ